MNHLRVFGCDAYAHIPKDERTKFDAKTRKCIMVGYGMVTKGYRLYDIKEKILRSRDVHFNESAKDLREATHDDTNDYQLIIYLCNDSRHGDCHSIMTKCHEGQPEKKGILTILVENTEACVKRRNNQPHFRKLLQVQTRLSGKLQR